LTSIVINSMLRNGSAISQRVAVHRDDLDHLGPLLDTGSTLIHLDPTTYNSLMLAINSMCIDNSMGWVGICDYSARFQSNNWTTYECINVTAHDLQAWPSLAFEFQQFGNANGVVNVTLKPLTYMNPISNRSDKDKYWCRGFVEAPVHANINIGDPLFRASFVVHDLQHMRIGFAKPSRKYCH
jgi:hypothetical protein